MLVLSRNIGEAIVIGDDIVVKVCGIYGERVRVGIEARRHVRIARTDEREANRVIAQILAADGNGNGKES